MKKNLATVIVLLLVAFGIYQLGTSQGANESKSEEVLVLSALDIAQESYDAEVIRHNHLVYSTLIESKKALLNATERFQKEKKNVTEDASELMAIAARLRETQKDLEAINANEFSPDVLWVSSKVSAEDENKALREENERLKQ